MFDPYRKWLGIQPKEQPPNYYRLLSVDLFETDLDVIEGAADRSMGFVRQYQSGEYAEDAARILNELATARLCLMKPEKKAEYDAKLRKELTAAATKPPPENSIADVPLSDTDLKPRALVVKRKKKSAKAKAVPFPPVVIGIAFVAALAMLIFLARGRNEQIVEKQAEPQIEPSRIDPDKTTRHEDTAKPKDETLAKPSESLSPTAFEVKPPTKDDKALIKPKEPLTAQNNDSQSSEVKPPVNETPVPEKVEKRVEFSLVRTWQGAMGKTTFGAFSQDGSQFVYGFGNDVLIAETETGKIVTKFPARALPATQCSNCGCVGLEEMRKR